MLSYNKSMYLIIPLVVKDIFVPYVYNSVQADFQCKWKHARQNMVSVVLGIRNKDEKP